MNTSQIIQVAAGAIVNDQNQVLISKRAIGSHQGGKWEFPGGKCEAGETIESALRRELFEELAIHVHAYEPLIALTHRYPEKTVTLHVFRITSYSGLPRSCEGQPLEWRTVDQLDPDDFPAADHGIIRALQLPRVCLITSEVGTTPYDQYLTSIEQSLQRGAGMVVLRDHQLSKADYSKLAGAVKRLCNRYHTTCVLNMPFDWTGDIDADGVHLTATRLRAVEERPATFRGLLGASCHNLVELQHAVRLSLDYVFVSPVLKTRSHPEAVPLGWQGFQRLVEIAPMPVYGLGGLTVSDLPQALAAGGQGIAGVSGL